MLNRKPLRISGVTLIELMIGITIMSLLMVAAVPSYQQWIQNTQLRTAAESIQNGLQLARATAVRDNTSVQFIFTGAGNVSSWSVGADDPAVAGLAFTVPVQARTTEGSAQARVGTSIPLNVVYGTALPAGSGGAVVFNSLGRVAAGSITRIDVLNPSAAAARRLVIVISSGGQLRMCDPALTLSVSPQACA